MIIRDEDYIEEKYDNYIKGYTPKYWDEWVMDFLYHRHLRMSTSEGKDLRDSHNIMNSYVQHKLRK